MKIELNKAQCAAIRAALSEVAWQLDRANKFKNISIDLLTPHEWKCKTGNQEGITLVSAQLRELATLFLEEK